ncbi:MAG: hypothetical protein LH654_12635 [Thermoleophilia bacterium]|nr:hypothetical protein [Thermoleophilia bacterium]
MSQPQRGEIFGLAIDGASAEVILILSENDWNAFARDCVVVPFYRDPSARESLIRPRLDDELIGNCTRVTSLAQADLGSFVSHAPTELIHAVADGVRAYFGLDDLLDPPRVCPPVGGRAGRWQRQAIVYKALRIAPTPKWVAIVSEDPSNVALEHAAGMRLTSNSKQRRSRWEIPVRGGCAIANDLHLIPYSGFDERPSNPPPFPRLNQTEMRELAERLISTLEL